jgi:SET domain
MLQLSPNNTYVTKPARVIMVPYIPRIQMRRYLARWAVDAKHAGGAGRFVNHSCARNLFIQASLISGPIVLSPDTRVLNEGQKSGSNAGQHIGSAS